MPAGPSNDQPMSKSTEEIAALIKEKGDRNEYDVFLCHNSDDKPIVKEIGIKLKSCGLLPWLDEWDLRPGYDWVEELGVLIKQSNIAVAVFVGKNNLGPWQSQEVYGFLRSYAKQEKEKKYPIIPVLLPDCDTKPELPIFLDGKTWVDFRVSDPNPFERLIWGITGKKIQADFGNVKLRQSPEQQHSQVSQGQQQKQKVTEQGKSASPSPQGLPSPPATPTLQPCEFQVATLTANRSGLLGMKVDYTVHRRPGQASLFVEDLGNGVQLEMVKILGGTFPMGSPENEKERSSDEGPQHKVTIQPFFLGKFTVTQAQWKAIATLPKVKIDLNPDPSNFKGSDRPVEQISWHEAVEFCDRLSRKTNRKYRLPSEAEWEYACRAGTTTPFHFGETITTDIVNYDGDYTYGSAPKGKCRGETMPVGSFKIANAFGLYDMHGNVREWCADHWHENYQNAPTDGSAWITGGDGDRRLLRGGSWDSLPWYCRSALRYWLGAGSRFNVIGFRLALSLPGLQ